MIERRYVYSRVQPVQPYCRSKILIKPVNIIAYVRDGDVLTRRTEKKKMREPENYGGNAMMVTEVGIALRREYENIATISFIMRRESLKRKLGNRGVN